MKMLCSAAAVFLCFVPMLHAQTVEHAEPSTAAAESTTEGSKPVPSLDTEADEAAIRANAEKYVEAYNRRDSAAMAKMWSPEAIYTDPRTGLGVVGREAIKEQFDHALAGQEDAKLAITIDSVEFVSPNVAIERGTAIVTYSDHPSEESEYAAVHIKRDGEWVIDRISESEIPAPPPSNYEHLQPLEWMIGSWVDGDDRATIHTECDWTKNKNFITRSFVVDSGADAGLSGIQIVGWDGAAQQIRSWVFDSQGGFGEGTWTATEDGWSIQSVGTLPDGRRTSSTNIVKRIDDDSYTWEAVNREVDGELLPNIAPATIVRAAAEITNN